MKRRIVALMLPTSDVRCDISIWPLFYADLVYDSLGLRGIFLIVYIYFVVLGFYTISLCPGSIPESPTQNHWFPTWIQCPRLSHHPVR